MVTDNRSDVSISGTQKTLTQMKKISRRAINRATLGFTLAGSLNTRRTRADALPPQ
jgi:N-acyl-D-aspartate/D-glutamate deacylase